MSLQNVIDFFLSRLEPYNPAYEDEEEETTDADVPRLTDSPRSRQPEDIQLLIDNATIDDHGEEEGSGIDHQTVSVKQGRATEEREDYAKPRSNTPVTEWL